MAKKMTKGLGKGLDSLFSGDSKINSEEEGERLQSVPIDSISPGAYQPRTDMDDELLEELSKSIAAKGVIQPIIVRELPNGAREIVAGERRWRASKLAGLQEVPVIIKDISDEDSLLIGLVENVQRKNLNPIEEAKGFKRLAEEFGLTHEKISEMVGKSRSAISNSLRLLGLEDEVQDFMYLGQLEMGHARALLSLDRAEQIRIANIAADRKLSVREVERMVKASLEKSQQGADGAADGQGGKAQGAMGDHEPLLGKIQDKLTDKFSVKVVVKSQDGDKGTVQFRWNDKEEFEHLMKKLSINLDDWS